MIQKNKIRATLYFATFQNIKFHVPVALSVTGSVQNQAVIVVSLPLVSADFPPPRLPSLQALSRITIKLL